MHKYSYQKSLMTQSFIREQFFMIYDNYYSIIKEYINMTITLDFLIHIHSNKLTWFLLCFVFFLQSMFILDNRIVEKGCYLQIKITDFKDNVLSKIR